jgi:hypothetical protein
MNPIPAIAVLLAGIIPAFGAGSPPPDKVLDIHDYSSLQRQVETLRGKKFLHPVPVYKVSKKELRAIADRETDKTFPGAKLKGYEELLAWLDMIPPHTDLKAVYAEFCAEEVDGFYVSEDKNICIPMSSAPTNAAKKIAQGATIYGNIVLAHEFTHALEDQYWPLDDPEDENDKLSTDRGTAHQFLAEGSATREMIEDIPSQLADGNPYAYFGLWNTMHSGPAEMALEHVFDSFWKDPGVVVPGLPETLARSESIPYSAGYRFCTEMMRKWGLDGLDHFYTRPVTSSAQVMHPEKAWEWREIPVQIKMPDPLPGGWKLASEDSVGESDTAILFGVQFTNLNRGLEIARGWDGDHMALYDTGGHKVFVWASSWESAYDAGLFARSCARERQSAHNAVITRDENNRIDWKSADGRFGFVQRAGKRVILVESDQRDVLSSAEDFVRNITFTTRAELKERAAANSFWRRFNPIWSEQKDGDYTVKRTIGGLLSRHDRNSVGASDRYLMGMLGETRRTASFHKWEIGGGWIVKHEDEQRRGFSKTTLLPWGVLASRCVARLPQSPDKTISRSSLLWGALASVSESKMGGRSIHVLPFGLLFRETTKNGHSVIHILGVPVKG